MTIRPIMLLRDTTGYEVEWATGLPLPGERTSSDFYKGHSNFVCEVKKAGFVVDIYCDGDMSYYNSKNSMFCGDGDDLVAQGYDTDEKLADAIESQELEHRNNPWFDLYVRGEHLDAVAHDINEALGYAMAWLDEEVANAMQIEFTA